MWCFQWALSRKNVWFLVDLNWKNQSLQTLEALFFLFLFVEQKIPLQLHKKTYPQLGFHYISADHFVVTTSAIRADDRGSHEDFTRPRIGVLSLLCRLDLDRFSSRIEPERILENISLETANFIVPLPPSCCCCCCCGVLDTVPISPRWEKEVDIAACKSPLSSVVPASEVLFLGRGRRKYVSPGVRIISVAKILPSCVSKSELEWHTKCPGYSCSKSATRIGL